MDVWAIFTVACLVSASIGFRGGWRARGDAAPSSPSRVPPLDVIEPAAHFEQVRRIDLFDFEADR